jgi:hypothetical protein
MHRRVAIAIVLVLGLSIYLEAQTLPAQLSSEAFRKLILDFSEPDGYFQYENFVSNEDDYAKVLPALKKSVKPGGIFVGVGPEQNFSYITTFRPAMAFVVDIRRQNMIEHLFYKALFEMSANRADFVSRLFARTRPSGLDTGTDVTVLFKAFEAAKPDQKLYDNTLAAIYNHLAKTHGFQLSTADKEGVAKIYTAFFQGGPQMDYRFNSYSAPTPSATYTQLMAATDADGKMWSYLVTEENFQLIQDYQKKNLIVPLVGDFAGPKTIRAIGQYAREHKTTVNVFYTSNVDEYLFRDTAKDRFFASVATLPMDASSALIRFVGGPGGLSPLDTVRIAPGKRWAALWCSMPELVGAFKEGRLSARIDANRLCMP